MAEIEETIRQQIADGCTRDDVAKTYRAGQLVMSEVDWPAVNRMIRGRWSTSGLAYIRRRSWALNL